MKMNKIILGFACASLLAFTSCADSFLKEEPKSELAGAGFFTSAKNVQASVNNLYRTGANNWYSTGVYNGSNHMWGGWRAGLFLNNEYGEMSHSMSKPLARIDAQSNAHDNWLASLYNDPFIYIQRANAIIKFVPDMDPKATGITDAEKTQFVAEAKVFRAQNYMWLVRQFGDVPLILENQSAADDLELEKTPKEQVWARIILDLEEAVAGLPAKSMYDNGMRITATVASATLIDAYMSAAGITGNASLYTKAAAEAKKFLPGGAYAGIHELEQHTIDPNFDMALVDTTIANYVVNGANINIFNPGEGSAYNKLRNVNAAGPTAKGYNKWAPEAQGGQAPKSSKEYIYAIEYFIGISNIGVNQSAWPTTVEGLGSGETKTTLLNNSYRPERRLLAIYDSANDMRAWERQFYANFFIRKNLDPVNNPESNTPSPYFYYDFQALKETNSSGRHWAIYRLAEMYLFAAEAIAQAEGVTAQAIDALVAVKKRAYITKTEAQIRAAIPTAKQAFIEEVWRERYRELPVEYKAWWDIQRTGKYPKTNEYSQYTPADNPAIDRGDCIFVDASTVYNEVRGEAGTKYPWAGKSMYLPFGESVMQKNPKLR